jgi:hypothetical protein
LIMKVQTVEEAIEVGNSTIYGLGGAVFGSKSRDLEKVINGVETVGMAVNDFATFYVCQLPFGGTKKSGYGRFMGPEGLRALCNAKVFRFSLSTDIAEYLFRSISLDCQDSHTWHCRLPHHKCCQIMAIRARSYVFGIRSSPSGKTAWNDGCPLQFRTEIVSQNRKGRWV